MARLWDRGTPLDAAIERFTVGRDPELDLRLVPYDCLGSAAHATMLARIGVLAEDEAAAARRELARIVDDVAAGRFAIRRDQEDGHTAIEARLTERLGETGRRIHTGRSRNDQVIAALRLYAREALVAQADALATVAERLCDLADEERETTIPGYTHTRQAMPTTLGHFFAAHAEGLLDAYPFIDVAYGHVDRSPLGSASGYGVALPLDREQVRALLDFGALQVNTLAVQNDRGKTEALVLGALLGPAIDLGRLAADLIWYSSDELRYLTLPDELTTGSSIMPNKRNPDALELARATVARLRAHHAAIAGIVAPLPSGYHRDLQLTKEPFLEGMQAVEDLLVVLGRVLAGVGVDRDRCREAVGRAAGATDEVYRRVAKGEPFRDAYKEVARDPEGAVSGDPRQGWRDRRHAGAPGALDVGRERDRLAVVRAWVAANRGKHAAVWDRLLADR